MASSAEMSSLLSLNITPFEEVQLLRAQLVAQQARQEAARSETETLRASNGSLERDLEEARTQLAAARAEIEHMLHHGFESESLTSDPQTNSKNQEQQRELSAGANGKPAAVGEPAVLVLVEGGSGYLCEYRSRLLDANKQVNTLKLTIDELTAENSRLKGADGGTKRVNKAAKPTVTLVPYPPTLKSDATGVVVDVSQDVDDLQRRLRQARTEIENRDLEIAKLVEDKRFLTAMYEEKQKIIAQLREEAQESSSINPENFLTRTVSGINHEYELIMLQQQEVMRKEIARVYDAIHGLQSEHFSSKTEADALGHKILQDVAALRNAEGIEHERLKDELIAAIELLLRKYSDLHSVVEHRDAQVDQLMQQLEITRKRFAEIELVASKLRESNDCFKSTIEAKEKEIEELNKLIQSFQEQIKAVTKECEQAKSNMISHKTHAESLLDELDSLRRSEFVENEDHITKHNTSGLSTARRSQSSNKEVQSLRADLENRDISIKELETELAHMKRLLSDKEHKTKNPGLENQGDMVLFESQKKEIARLNEVIAQLSADLENARMKTNESNNRLIPNHSDSGKWESRTATFNEEVNSLRTVIAEKDTLISKLRKEIHESSEKASKYSTLEYRIKSMSEELTNLKRLLADKEDVITKMRLEIHKNSTTIIDYKDSDEYRSLMQQYKLILQQQENLQKENRTLLEQVEKLRRESLAMTTQREAANVTINFELESQKKEVSRLTQIIESLRLELENTKQEKMKQKSGVLESRIKSLTEEANALRAALTDRDKNISKLHGEIRESTEKAGKSSVFELRIKSLTEENLALRKALVEREEAISKLHISVQESSRRIIDYKDSDDYRALLNQYQLLVQQLEASQKEICAMREQADKFQREILVIRSQSEESSSSAKFELENSKREMVRLNQIIESLRIELESSKKQASELHIIREQFGSLKYRIQSLNEEVKSLSSALNEREIIISKLLIENRESKEKVQKISTYELRIKSLVEEISALRAVLTERDDTVSKLRVEIHKSNTIVDYKGSEDYRALCNQYQLLVQQFETSQKEIRTIREHADKFQREIIVLKNQLESGSATIKFELENSKREVSRLNQILDSLRHELETSKKQAFEAQDLRIGQLVQEVAVARKMSAEQAAISNQLRNDLADTQSLLASSRTLIEEREALVSQLRRDLQDAQAALSKERALLSTRLEQEKFIESYEVRLRQLTEERNAALKGITDREALVEQLRKEAQDRDAIAVTLRSGVQAQSDLAMQTIRNELIQKETLAAQYRRDLSDTQSALDASRRTIEELEALVAQLRNDLLAAKSALFNSNQASQTVCFEQYKLNEGYESRLRQLADDRNAALKMLSDQETLVSQLRKEAQDRDRILKGIRTSKEAQSISNASLDAICQDLQTKELLVDHLRKNVADTQSSLAAAHRTIDERETQLAIMRKDLQDAQSALSRRERVSQSALLEHEKLTEGYKNRLSQLAEDRNETLNKITELEEQVSKLQKEINDKQAFIYTLANQDGSGKDDGHMQSLRNDLEEAQAIAVQLRKDLINTQLTLDNAHREIEQRDSLLNKLQKDLQNANYALSIREKTAQSESIEQDKHSLDYESRLRQLTEDRNAAIKGLSENEVLLAQLRGEVQEREVMLEKLRDKESQEKSENVMQSIRQELQLSDASNTALRKELQEKEGVLSALRIDLSSKESRISIIQTELQEMYTLIEQLTKERDALIAELTRLQSKLVELELKTTELNGEYLSLVQAHANCERIRRSWIAFSYRAPTEELQEMFGTTNASFIAKRVSMINGTPRLVTVDVAVENADVLSLRSSGVTSPGPTGSEF